MSKFYRFLILTKMVRIWFLPFIALFNPGGLVVFKFFLCERFLFRAQKSPARSEPGYVCSQLGYDYQSAYNLIS